MLLKLKHTVLNHNDLSLCGYRTSDRLWIVTPPASGAPASVRITMQLDTGDRYWTDEMFWYQQNPIVVDIQPRNHLIAYVDEWR